MSKILKFDNPIPLLEEARKDIDYFTQEEYDSYNDDHYSEWAISLASLNWDEDNLTVGKVAKDIHDARIQQTLDDLVNKGLIDEFWDSDKEEICYIAKEVKNEEN